MTFPIGGPAGNQGDVVGTYQDKPITGKPLKTGFKTEAAARTFALQHEQSKQEHTAIRKEGNGTWTVMTLNPKHLPEGLTDHAKAMMVASTLGSAPADQLVKDIKHKDFVAESAQLMKDGKTKPNVSFISAPDKSPADVQFPGAGAALGRRVGNRGIEAACAQIERLRKQGDPPPSGTTSAMEKAASHIESLRTQGDPPLQIGQSVPVGEKWHSGGAHAVNTIPLTRGTSYGTGVVTHTGLTREQALEVAKNDRVAGSGLLGTELFSAEASSAIHKSVSASGQVTYDVLRVSWQFRHQMERPEPGSSGPKPNFELID